MMLGRGRLNTALPEVSPRLIFLPNSWRGRATMLHRCVTPLACGGHVNTVTNSLGWKGRDRGPCGSTWTAEHGRNHSQKKHNCATLKRRPMGARSALGWPGLRRGGGGAALAILFVVLSVAVGLSRAGAVTGSARDVAPAAVSLLLADCSAGAIYSVDASYSDELSPNLGVPMTVVQDGGFGGSAAGEHHGGSGRQDTDAARVSAGIAQPGNDARGGTPTVPCTSLAPDWGGGSSSWYLDRSSGPRVYWTAPDTGGDGRDIWSADAFQGGDMRLAANSTSLGTGADPFDLVVQRSFDSVNGSLIWTEPSTGRIRLAALRNGTVALDSVRTVARAGEGPGGHPSTTIRGLAVSGNVVFWGESIPGSSPLVARIARATLHSDGGANVSTVITAAEAGWHTSGVQVLQVANISKHGGDGAPRLVFFAEGYVQSCTVDGDELDMYGSSQIETSLSGLVVDDTTDPERAWLTYQRFSHNVYDAFYPFERSGEAVWDGPALQPAAVSLLVRPCNTCDDSTHETSRCGLRHNTLCSSFVKHIKAWQVVLLAAGGVAVVALVVCCCKRWRRRRRRLRVRLGSASSLPSDSERRPLLYPAADGDDVVAPDDPETAGGGYRAPSEPSGDAEAGGGGGGAATAGRERIASFGADSLPGARSSVESPPVVAATSYDECVVCLDRKPDVFLVPCSHRVTCEQCAQQLLAAGFPCPVCMTPFEGTVQMASGSKD